MALKLLLLGGKPVKKLDHKLYQNFYFTRVKNSIELTKDQRNCLKKQPI